LSRFVELAARLQARHAGHQAVFVVGPTEVDWWGEGEVAELRKRFAVLTAPSLEVLAGAAAGASAFVGNDSGPTHLAAAVGTRSVAIFGPTNARHFAPRGRAVTVIDAGDLGNLSAEDVANSLPEKFLHE
jgi:ADP-heptose:LPS heptosyltransferase